MDSSPDVNQVEVSLTKMEIYNLLKGQLNCSLHAATVIIEEHLSRKLDRGFFMADNMKKSFKNVFYKLRIMWKESHRTEDRFLKKNKTWLDSVLSLTDDDCDKSNLEQHKPFGRPSTSFSDCSDRTKRRRTEKLRSDHTTEELAYATMMSLRASGKNAAARVVKNVTMGSPSKASSYLSSVDQVRERVMTPAEAPSVFVKRRKMYIAREEVPGVATTLQLLPEQTEEPFLGVVNKPRSYKKGSDKTYCRFCLQSSGKNTSTPLAVVDLNYPGKSDVFRKKKMEKVEEINKMLRFCLPFYDSLTFNPVICSICLGRLKVAYEFSKQCFKNQQLIEKYADTYSATERVINLNEMIETKFKLPDDGNMSESETFSDIPQVTRTSNRISQKRKYPNYNDPPLKKRKACSETYEDDSTNSSDNTSNIKIEPDDDDNSGLIESLKMELDDEDNSFGFTERTLDDVPQSYNISEEGIKVEPNYIDCPDFIKSEQVDDLHEEHKVFDERTGIGTDSERQHLYSQGLGNVSVATKNDPLFVKEPSFSTVGTGLEDSTDD